MDRPALSRFWFRLRYRAQHLPMPWWLAFACLLASAMAYFNLTLPARAQQAELRMQATTLEGRNHQLQQAREEAESRSPDGQLAGFLQHFPGEKSLADTLDLLISLAQSHGLEPRQAQYSVERTNPAGLFAYQITLPLQGKYPSVKAYAFDLLNKVPNLSLDGINVERKQVAEDRITASLVMTLYLRRSEP